MVEGIIMDVSFLERGVDLEVVKLKLGGVNETESEGWRLRGCAAGCEFVYHAWWYVIGVCWV